MTFNENTSQSTEAKALRELRRLGTQFLLEKDLRAVLEELIQAAIHQGADFGNIQILDPSRNRLEIFAQQGFEQWWLDYWKEVSEGHGVCGVALFEKSRIIVEDIERSPVFVGTEALWVQRHASVRAVQSTPLIGWDGKLIGMFSTHYNTVHHPDDKALQAIDTIAFQAAHLIERSRLEELIHRTQQQLREQISELKKKEEEIERLARNVNHLSRSNHDLDSFASLVCHDLQEPIRNLSTYLSLISKSLPQAKEFEVNDYLENAKNTAKWMSEMIYDMLDFSRSKHEKKLDWTDSAEVIKDVYHALEVNYGEVNLKIICGDLPVIWVNTTLLQLLFENLMTNAIKFRREIPLEISITSEKRDKFWCFSFSDNGSGIAENYLERVFTLYQRKSEKQDCPGYGVGLALCKKIVERWGGEIWVRSKEGEGTTFTFTIPREMKKPTYF